jgi:hypothetical protein
MRHKTRDVEIHGLFHRDTETLTARKHASISATHLPHDGREHYNIVLRGVTKSQVVE